MKRRYLAAPAAGIATWALIVWLLGPPDCRDGWNSPSIGSTGACSHHDGVDPTNDIAAIIGGLLMAGAILFFAQGRRPRGPAIPAGILAPLPCPRCSRPMDLKARETGRGFYWGCPDAPACTGTRDYEG